MRNKFYQLAVTAVAVALLTAGVAFAQGVAQTPTTSQANPVTRTINVSGVGKVYISPDIAYVTIGVHTENKDAAQAVAQNNTQSTAVKEALTGMGVDPKDIQTSNFSIYPQQQYDQNGKPTGEITYQVDNQLFVTVRDISKIGDILDTVVKAGANNIYGISFDVADRSKALEDARKLAVSDAQTQANQLADAAGVKVGDVQTISTTNAPTPVPMYDKAMGGGVAAAAAPSVPVSPGQMTIEVDVYMVFAIQ